MKLDICPLNLPADKCSETALVLHGCTKIKTIWLTQAPNDAKCFLKSHLCDKI